ncbi:Rieske (2Fe-2S) protein [Arcanobacterium buesumense]|uniref:Non-heme iron oxygenase ferredoxin subunit n=1 Tax=Arcanobacterium buesumense TaxID=2722751 RepID=A0A6H2EL92_9ACTO|nr:non-heme iron oxygenase ferredoxin subunit [Arcanobacterium buesumense]QJC21839.1 non-heme iron oxygenase ferredoxin subunit [Arcanobacterium buesumense]
MPEHRVCTIADVAPGTVQGFEVITENSTPLPVAVIHSQQGNWFAVHNQCTHGRVKLSDGWVEDESIECSQHGAAFDLATGEVMTLPASQPVTIYPVRVDGENVYITVNS